MKNQEMKKEALKRMDLLNLAPYIKEEYEEQDLVCCSGLPKRSNDSKLLLLREDPRLYEKAKAFEEEYECLVYYAIYQKTSLGELLTLLYVSREVLEWIYDKHDIEAVNPDGSRGILAYVENLDYPHCSEFGYVGVAEEAGELFRIS